MKWIVGSGNHGYWLGTFELLKQQVLQQYVKAEMIVYDNQVQFLGEVPYDELPRLYRRASLFVLPSRLETFGLTLVEAMASGVPVVASNLDVISEICSGAALYFDPFSPADMAERMLMVLNDPQLQEELRQRGLRRARDFSWEKCAR